MDVLQSTPRSTNSGRRFPNHYHNETSLEDITHDCRQEVDDLINHNRATECTLQMEERKRNIVNIQEFIRNNGYNTILDVFLDEVLISHFREQKEIRQALNNGGIAKILSFCYSRSITDTPKIQQEICRYAGMIFEREIKQLTQSTELRAPMQVFRYQNSF